MLERQRPQSRTTCRVRTGSECNSSGESIGTAFERGIGRHPNVNDEVHIVTERDLARIYGSPGAGQVAIGRLSSAENVSVKVDISKIVTRHSAVLGATGSGKSTTVTSLIRSIVAGDDGGDLS